MMEFSWINSMLERWNECWLKFEANWWMTEFGMRMNDVWLINQSLNEMAGLISVCCLLIDFWIPATKAAFRNQINQTEIQPFLERKHNWSNPAVNQSSINPPFNNEINHSFNTEIEWLFDWINDGWIQIERLINAGLANN